MLLARVLCPDLIGRDAEMSALEDALFAAVRGEGGVVAIGGDAGMGKTRLIGTLADRARSLGCTYMSGACSEADLSLPYLPFLEATGNHIARENIVELRSRLGSATEELAQLFPQMGRPGTTAGDPTQAKMRLFESFLMLLRDAARSRALVLAIEDIHWADPATRELLDYMTRRLRTGNILVVATYRTDELNRRHPLLPMLQGWRRSGQIQMVELERLSPVAVAGIVRAIFEDHEVSADFRDFMHVRSEGNPFVLEEMLREALDRGDIFMADGRWDRKALGEMRIPGTVRDAILMRLERLTREQSDVMAAASVIGRTFDLATLIPVTGRSETEVLEAIEACVTNQLLEDDDGDSSRYRFRHALTREAVYEDLVAPRRQQLHARVAEAIEARPDGAPIELAHHLLLAGNYERAVPACIAAAAEASRTRAYRDAGMLLEKAAPHVRDVAERGRLLCMAGEAYWNSAEPGVARGLLEHGIDDFEAAGKKLEAAENRLLLGRCLWELQRSDLARAQFERARDDLELAGPSEALAVAYIRLSGLGVFNEGAGAGLADARRAFEIAEQVGAGAAASWAKNFIGISEVDLGDVTLGLRHVQESYDIAMAGGYSMQAGNAGYNAAWLCIHLGLGRDIVQWAERIQSGSVPTAEVWLNYVRGLIAVHQGRIGVAIEEARMALHRARESGHTKMNWRASVLLAQALAEAGIADEAQAVLPAISSRVETQDAIYDTHARVRVALATGNAGAVREAARSVAPPLCELGSPADAVAEVSGGDPGWLHEFLAAVPLKGENRDSPRWKAAQGRLALAEGDVTGAIGKLDESVQRFHAEGFHVDAWHVGRDLAEAEARAGQIEGARARLDSIIESCEMAGAALAASLARATASKLGLDVRSASVSEVAPADELVATGERMVSVLFADVRGYTAMSADASPAEMVGRITSLQRWATHEVSKRRGNIDKFAGDAVMATFNISGRSVDHTLHAVQAALEIIQKAALAGLPVGAGVAVGPAVVGRFTTSANMSVLGDVTNLASRLQAQSSAGEVTMSEEAHRRVRDWLDRHEVTAHRVELTLKGIEAPVIAFRIKAQSGAPHEPLLQDPQLAT